MITGRIATVTPYGLKTPHPGIAGLIRVSDGTFLVYQSTELTLFPGGPRLRVGTPCTAIPDPPYARDVQLTGPIPFP
jgi:hypothetical protein